MIERIPNGSDLKWVWSAPPPYQQDTVQHGKVLARIMGGPWGVFQCFGGRQEQEEPLGVGVPYQPGNHVTKMEVAMGEAERPWRRRGEEAEMASSSIINQLTSDLSDSSSDQVVTLSIARLPNSCMLLRLFQKWVWLQWISIALTHLISSRLIVCEGHVA